MTSNCGSVLPVTGIETRISLKLSNFQKIFDKIGDRPVAIVSVNGPMRTGKSYILTQFQRFLATKGQGDWVNHHLEDEFQWKNSANRQTVGINLWSEPYFVIKDGHEVAVLLMDTQGCFDDQTTLMESAYNFAISILLSSVLVYNISKQITEDMLQFLQLFIGYAKVSAEEEVGPERFQRLLFLIRDWQFPDDFEYGYYDDHHSAAKKNFKNEKLDPLVGMPDQVRIVHQEIVDSFQSVGCCLMPYPGHGLATRDITDNLSPEFIDIVTDLMPRIFAPENLAVKTIGGIMLTGTALKHIVAGLDQMFAENPIPDIKTISQENADAQIRIATSVALKLYIEQMKTAKTSSGLHESQLLQLHDQAMAKAVQVFKEMRQIHGNAGKEQALVALEHQITSKLKFYKDINSRRFQMREATLPVNSLEQDFHNQSLCPIPLSNYPVAQQSEKGSLTSPTKQYSQASNKPKSSSETKSSGKRSAPPVPQNADSKICSSSQLKHENVQKAICSPEQHFTQGQIIPKDSKRNTPLQSNSTGPKHMLMENSPHLSKNDQRRSSYEQKSNLTAVVSGKSDAHPPAPFTKAGKYVDQNVVQPFLHIAQGMLTAITTKRATHI